MTQEAAVVQQSPKPSPKIADEAAHRHICRNCMQVWRCEVAECELAEVTICLTCFKTLGAGYY
jgi:hypothetical protein